MERDRTLASADQCTDCFSCSQHGCTPDMLTGRERNAAYELAHALVHRRKRKMRSTHDTMLPLHLAVPMSMSIICLDNYRFMQLGWPRSSFVS